MKKIILFTLLALTACKKEPFKKDFTVDVTGEGSMATYTYNGKTYSAPLPVMVLKKGESIIFKDTGMHPSDHRTIAITVDSKVVYNFSSTGLAQYTYTAK